MLCIYEGFGELKYASKRPGIKAGNKKQSIDVDKETTPQKWRVCLVNCLTCRNLEMRGLTSKRGRWKGRSVRPLIMGDGAWILQVSASLTATFGISKPRMGVGPCCVRSEMVGQWAALRVLPRHPSVQMQRAEERDKFDKPLVKRQSMVNSVVLLKFGF